MKHPKKTAIPIWPYKIITKNKRNFVKLPLPDKTFMVVEFYTQEELKAAQYKARSTAKGIVHSIFSYAF